MTPDTAVVHVKITNHGKERLLQRVAPVSGGMAEAKRWVKEAVRDAAERHGFSRSQPDWVKRHWCLNEPEPKGSNVRYVKGTIGDHRFCIVVGYEKAKRKREQARWNVITVLPESELWDRGVL